MTSFAPKEFAPEEFFRGGGVGEGQICNDELPSKNSKNVDFDCIMKAFFYEGNKKDAKAKCKMVKATGVAILNTTNCVSFSYQTNTITLGLFHERALWTDIVCPLINILASRNQLKLIWIE